jgi:hypothetical protein
MSELGPSIKQTVEFLQSIHKDISSLISAVNEGLKKVGFESMTGNSACYGAASKSPDYPLWWMPRTFFRVYALSPTDPDSKHHQVVVFQVFMVPKKLSQPIALWGLAMQETPDDDTLTRLRAFFESPDGPQFLDRELETRWRTVPNTGFDSFEFCSCPLVELKDQAAVEQTVINPLIERLKTPAPPAPPI